ncbi:hypothetical protein L6452_43173 [Arctium lappa]|uniref:Uncharacterized protein n=1 Tax=Arctium lappa TaxID=4217 RepID=A0ACB8XJN1_ARCLA|nr:hypothetical protein L6452_43173 [Arctium lappa]
MVNEIESQCDREAMLHETSKKSLTNAQKRWRRAYFSIIGTTPTSSSSSYDAHNINPEATNHDDHSEGCLSIDKHMLADLVKTKDLGLLRKFNGVEGLAKALQTNLDDGINGEDTKRRIILFDSNSYKQASPKGFLYFLVEGFKDITKLFQLLVAAISLGFSIKEDGAKEGWYDHGGSIFVSVLVIALSAVSNFIQKRQLQYHLSEIDVVREGRRQKISIFEVVVGDVVVLAIGDRIPADGLFIDGHDHSLLVDESSMMMTTGTSDRFVEIDAIRNPFLIAGSKVADGYARMLVISVWMNTARGKMMSSKTGDSDEQTPLQSRLNKLTTIIGKIACVVAFLDLLAISIRCLAGNTDDENGNRTDTIDIPFVTRAVLAIAEGLSLALTFTLAYSTKGVTGDVPVVVRNLFACETMGSTTVICTHKTGTLTMNLMKVTKFWVGLDDIEDVSSVDAKVLQLYHQGVGLNTTGSIYKSSVPGTESEYCGSPTEKALLSWADTSLGMDIEKEKRSCTVLQVKTFNSEKKRSRVLIRKKEDNTIHVHRKGAAEMVLAMCSNYYQKSGLIKPLNHEERTRIKNIIEGMAASSLRCIAFAHKQISEMEPKHNKDGKTPNEQGLTLLGVVGIKNPCRPGVKEAIETCRIAGVDVKMITSDNIFTAKAIATECGILEVGPHINGEEEVIEGKEFRNYTEEERMNRVDSIRVMARSSPSDKLLLVQCLKKKGHVVAVTGHRANDERALKEADVGISMGIQGTEVAKESSDIVILDDNFASIVKLLSWGRCVFDNIQKLIQFLLPPNLAAFVINFISDACGRGVPLTTVQMLWVNLVMVTFGALALAIQKPTKDLMLQKPPVLGITNVMWRNLLAQSLFQIVILLIIWFTGRSFFNVNESLNGMIIFNTFILCQLFNLFNSRKLEKMNVFEGVHKNMPFLGIVGLVMVLQVMIMVVFLNIVVADTQKLNMEQWGICIAFAALSLPIGWFVKLIPVPEAPFLSYI